MPLTQRQLELVRESFSVLRDDPIPKSIDFYTSLFRQAPELKAMFREDLAGQGMRFMATLGAIVDNLHDTKAMADRYADLGRAHRALGVRAQDFEPMGKALIETLSATLGDAFTPEMQEAWETAYTEFSRDIIAKGDIPQPPS
ncbi:Bacterial hemoglobin [Roseovarius litorisediminis]|uniref:Bacterial hemoglobin n=1 Tax=Roseovarius litorisediminis TaxID=1312363 RepID=A0A1Y5TN36_9RHOB|nr:globin domain-containing protein [Roseovarius litorisediminis]SLN67815.1 Bacterial hemoglobin [Roseovarius litorisediminis]